MTFGLKWKKELIREIDKDIRAGRKFDYITFDDMVEMNEKDIATMSAITEEQIEDDMLDPKYYCAFATCIKGMEAKLDIKAVKKGWDVIGYQWNEKERCSLSNQKAEPMKVNRINTEGLVGFEVFEPKVISSAINKKWFWNKKYKKGEKKLLKIIIKNRVTGKQKCVNIPKENENHISVKNLRVGMVVYYCEFPGTKPEFVEIVKIVNDKPLGHTLRGMPPYWTPYPWQKGLGHLQAQSIVYPKGAGRATFAKQYPRTIEKIREYAEGRKALKGYKDKPYFSVRLDPIKGQPDGKENLEKIKFPCWVVYRGLENGKDKIGMLVTGMPGVEPMEYQLIDMMEQVPVDEVCTIFRDKDLKKLLSRFYSVEVIKGESQCWKVGRFNV